MKLNFLCGTILGLGILSVSTANAAGTDWQKEIDELREDILVLQRQMYRNGIADNPMENKKSSSENISSEVQVKIGEYDEVIRKVNGRMDTLEHDIKTTNAKLDKISRDMEIRFKILEGRQVPASLSAPAPVQPTIHDSPIAQKPAKEVMGDSISGNDLDPIPTAIPEKQKDAPQPLVPENDLNIKPSASAPTTQPATAETMYQNGMQAYNAGLTDEAEIAFKEILSKYPKDKMAGNAQYWLGETYLKTGQLEKAKQAFKSGYENYPNGNKAADSLFKLGVTLARQNDTSRACIVYKSFSSEFPKANAELAKRVKAETDKLKCK